MFFMLMLLLPPESTLTDALFPYTTLFQSKIMPELASLIAALTLYNAAFVAEVVRAGIQSVGEGQRQAATALGRSPRLTMRLVIVPQAIRVMVPPMANQDRKSTRLNSSH